jgi:CRP/FNR family transcriptional regulator, cyclic AMP receptor protein
LLSDPTQLRNPPMHAARTLAVHLRANGEARPKTKLKSDRPSAPIVFALTALHGGKARPAGKVKQFAFDAVEFLAKAGLNKTIMEYPKGDTIFSQGNAADAVFYIQKGKAKVAVVSKQGKEATVAVLSAGDFIGEDCVATSHPLRLVTATALSDCVLLKIGRQEMVRVLAQEQSLSEVFVAFLLARNARIQEDLIDQLFNSSEKRLARILLLLAQFGKDDQPGIAGGDGWDDQVARQLLHEPLSQAGVHPIRRLHQGSQLAFERRS